MKYVYCKSPNLLKCTICADWQHPTFHGNNCWFVVDYVLYRKYFTCLMFEVLQQFAKTTNNVHLKNLTLHSVYTCATDSCVYMYMCSVDQNVTCVWVSEFVHLYYATEEGHS